ncbi:7-carboxy-7-deazaguanine synthase [Leptospira interrogans serovar Manilae]|uniref:7-carboxy-7-deazaguanine synthase n=2 Tax=Leptospira interrogans TaxID=173 RepID=A0AAQ1P122_LEPIR|nr:7-carboxy-7-deazaguanine synthase QueE [Leptospira interrogans]AKP24715.1 7-carboxy-7-deazaguanine synthase [Leptospira interrogans serovar Manilae]AKP28500.1 7-carboxy-7-deazaguanine synthase [Leptospira interrogans serovar Manilae]EMJ58286.1 4Fe-4S single cluster domain protein [Leptospira interrogans serovar Valbuzzi str. Duyster]ENO70297.1 4Fe-4S single cluster domain protein [Leptospira interrogans serovar Valbuzzi str. Valbuzzi]EYU63827.1 7-carboxy-7-deazaguanine synthase [Leptospira 
MDNLKTSVHEIYLSLSGEGISTGIPTIFVRMAGCSLRCGMTVGRKLWCDTPYALSPKAGEEMSVNQVLDKIQELSAVNIQILLTGGEPLEGRNREFSITLGNEIFRTRNSSGFYPRPRVETNGAESIEGMDQFVFTLDYKLPGSGMEDRMNLKNLEIYKERKNPLDEIKFVIRDKNDFERCLEIIEKHTLVGNLLASPVQGELSPEILAEWIKYSLGSGLRLSIQTHKYIWGDQRGV